MSDTDLQSSFWASNCTTWFFLMMVNSSRNRLRFQVINHSDQLLGKAPYKQWWMCECDFLGNAPLFKYVVVFLVAWVTPSFILFCAFCSHEQSLEDRMVFGKLQKWEKPVQGANLPLSHSTAYVNAQWINDLYVYWKRKEPSHRFLNCMFVGETTMSFLEFGQNNWKYFTELILFFTSYVQILRVILTEPMGFNKIQFTNVILIWFCEYIFNFCVLLLSQSKLTCNTNTTCLHFKSSLLNP